MDNKDAETNDVQEIEIDSRQELARILRAGRSEKALSIEDVAADSRISRYFIEALEEAKFDRLPEDVFVRGFVRNLLKIYEIESTKPTELLDQILKTEKDGSDSYAYEGRNKPNSVKITKRGNKPFFRTKRFQPIPAAILLIGLFIGSGLGLTYYFSQPEIEVAKDEPIKQKEVKTVKKVITDEQIVFVRKNDIESPQPTSQMPKKPQESGEIVDIKVNSQVRLRVSKDGGSWVTLFCSFFAVFINFINILKGKGCFFFVFTCSRDMPPLIPSGYATISLDPAELKMILKIVTSYDGPRKRAKAERAIIPITIMTIIISTIVKPLS